VKLKLSQSQPIGVNDQRKLPFGKQMQHMQGVGVATRAELLHAAEEQADWIVSVHTLHNSLAFIYFFIAGSFTSNASRPQL
jgi:hypothetical protein